MKKEDVGGILFSIRRNSRLLCELRFNSEGEFYRAGNGILPCHDFSVSGNSPSSKLWNDALKAVPEHLLKSQLFGENINLAKCTIYELHFTGNSQGVSDQTKTGIRIVHQSQGTYSHPLMPVVLKTGEALMAITDEHYLNGILKVAFEIRPETFAFPYKITGPSGFADRQQLLRQYTQELVTIGKFRKLLTKVGNKVYIDEYGNPLRIYFNYSNTAEISVKRIPTAAPENEKDLGEIYRLSRPRYIRGAVAYQSDEIPVHLIPGFVTVILFIVILGMFLIV